MDWVTLWANVRYFRWVPLADSFIFPATAIADLIIAGKDTAVTGLLRIAIGIVNFTAFMQIQRELRGWRNYGVRDPGLKAWDFPSIVAGQASAIPVLLIPFWIEFGGGPHDINDILVIAIATVLIFSALATTLGAIFGKSGSLNLSWGIVVALLPLAGLLQFWYTAIYSPEHERPRVNVIADLHEVRREGGVTQILGTVKLANVGAGELDVLGAMYTVTGYDAEPPDHLKKDVEKSALTPPWPVAWRDGIGYKGLLRVGHLIGPGGTLTPGQKLLTSFAFDVKNDTPKKLRLTIFLSLITHTGGGWGKFGECPPGSASACFQVKLPSESLIRDELADHPVARVSFQQMPVPHMVTDFLPRGASLASPSPSTTPKGKVKKVQHVDPYRLSRAAKSSVEYRLDP